MRTGFFAGLIAVMAAAGCAAPAEVRSGGGTTSSSAGPTTSAASPTVTPPAPVEVKLGTTADIIAAGWLAGVPRPTFDAGPSGKVSVVANGPITARPTKTSIVPIVVRNGTQRAVRNVEVTGAATDSSGRIVGSASSLVFSPTTVPAGGVAFGFLYFDPMIPEDVRIAFTVSSEQAAGRLNAQDLTVVQANAVGDAITGKATNNHAYSVKGSFTVNVTCFDDAGTLLTSELGFASPTVNVTPGGSVTYQVDLHGSPCPLFLVGVSGSRF